MVIQVGLAIDECKLQRCHEVGNDEIGYCNEGRPLPEQDSAECYCPDHRREKIHREDATFSPALLGPVQAVAICLGELGIGCEGRNHGSVVQHSEKADHEGDAVDELTHGLFHEHPDDWVTAIDTCHYAPSK